MVLETCGENADLCVSEVVLRRLFGEEEAQGIEHPHRPLKCMCTEVGDFQGTDGI